MKNILLISILSLISLNIYGQVWIDSNAVWHYDYTNVGYGGFSKYEYTKDTIIENHNCQVITGTNYEFTHNQYNELVQLGQIDLGNHYTFVSGDTVFYWNKNENTFFTLFDFGAQIGDSWVISTDPNNFVVDPNNDNDTSRIEVINTGTITINSNTYRFIKIKPTYGSTYGMEGTFVERFGNIDSTQAPFQVLFPSFYDYSGNQMVEWNRYNFKCYQDTSFSLYNPTNQDCEYLLTILETKEQKLNDFEYFPNPTTGEFTLNNLNNESMSIELYDNNGKLLNTFEITPMTKIEIDMSKYIKGLYFVKVVNGIIKSETIKIIKQ